MNVLVTQKMKIAFGKLMVGPKEIELNQQVVRVRVRSGARYSNKSHVLLSSPILLQRKLCNNGIVIFSASILALSGWLLKKNWMSIFMKIILIEAILR